MTPMIDIVFQLIIFFLLSLKFKSVEQRISTELPKDKGIQATAQFIEEKPMLTVKAFRKDMETDLPYTQFNVGNNHKVKGPAGKWLGTFEADDKMQIELDKTRNRIQQHISDMWAQMGNNPETQGEIKTPPPFGQGVPHGDIMLVLDAFLEAGVKNVQFEGAMPPNFTAGQGGVIEAN